MNKLKKLFSPRALATTITTGMLLHATVAWAYQHCYSTSAAFVPGCPGGTQQCFYIGLYWCCPNGSLCDESNDGYYFCGYSSSPITGYCGWCLCPDEG